MLALFVLLAAAPAAAQPGTDTLPQHSGELTVAGLQDRVEILRDPFGVAHIYASSTHDLFFAQGYTHAQDRWWQMEWARHTGYGRLGELAGSSVVANDIFVRTLGSRAVVEQEFAALEPEMQQILQAFADGVNAYLFSREPEALAYEYGALRSAGITITVEPWQPADTLIWGKVMQFSLGGNYGIELLLSELYTLDTLTPEMIDQYAPPFPFGTRPTILFPEDLPVSADSLADAGSAGLPVRGGIIGIHTRLAGGVAAGVDLGLGRTGFNTAVGSNNWVVSGALTDSGMPLLANDPHLSIQIPSIWYEIGLHCAPVSADCPFDVAGFTFPASPGVTIGHNGRIAWGVTNIGPDVQDLYMIRVNPDNPLQYEYNGEWRDMTTREEVILSGDGAAPVTITVRETHFGPIINDNQPVNGELGGFNNENPLALRWTALQPGGLVRASLGLNLAQNWQEFREALRYWDAPAQNFVYADVDGNIGYQTPGRLPVRAGDHSGLLPVPGWTDEYEWRGFIPFDSLPRILNPERGFIATANQPVVPPEYYAQLAADLGAEFGVDSNFALGYFFAYGYRAERIVNMISEYAPHTGETFAQMHGDTYNASAAELLPYLAPISFDSAMLNEARDWLLTWDYRMDADSPQAALYGYFWMRLVDNLYNDQFGAVYHASGNDNELWGTALLMRQPDAAWWDDINTTDVVETRDDILRRSFGEAYALTVEVLGADWTLWQWGDLHTATFVSLPLGRSGIPFVEAAVNRGPVAVSGGSEIVNATGWNLSRGDFSVRSLPSMRLIMDLSDFDSSLSIHPTGQSGHPGSLNYFDMNELWRTTQYRSMVWTRTQVETTAVNTLVLLPGD